MAGLGAGVRAASGRDLRDGAPPLAAVGGAVVAIGGTETSVPPMFPASHVCYMWGGGDRWWYRGYHYTLRYPCVTCGFSGEHECAL